MPQTMLCCAKKFQTIPQSVRLDEHDQAKEQPIQPIEVGEIKEITEKNLTPQAEKLGDKARWNCLIQNGNAYALQLFNLITYGSTDYGVPILEPLQRFGSCLYV